MGWQGLTIGLRGLKMRVLAPLGLVNGLKTHLKKTKTTFSILLRKPQAVARARPPGPGPGPAKKDGNYKTAAKK